MLPGPVCVITIHWESVGHRNDLRVKHNGRENAGVCVEKLSTVEMDMCVWEVKYAESGLFRTVLRDNPSP